TTVEETSAVATFDPKSIEILEQRLGVTLIKQTRSSWASADGNTVVICKASRKYDRGDYAYWFGLYEFQMEMITSVPKGYCALQCGESAQLLLLPATDLSSWTDPKLMNRTESKTRPYWHIHVSPDFQLMRKSGSPIIDLRRYLITQKS